MEEHVYKFMELLRYMDYIKDERVKIQSFLSGLPSYYKELIKFVDPQMLESSIQMAMHCYEKEKEKIKVWQAWNERSKGRFKPIKKEIRWPFT